MTLNEKLQSMWEGLTPRERSIVTLGGLGAAAVLVLYVGLKINDGLVALADQNAQARKALLVMQGLRAQGGVARNNDAPVLSATPVKLESYVENAATRAGAGAVQTFSRRGETKADGYVMNAGAVEFRGLTIAQVRDLLRAIEENPAVAVTNLTVIRNAFATDKEKLDIKLEVTAYSLDAPQEGEAPGEGTPGTEDGRSARASGGGR